MYKLIVQFLKFLFPILRKATLQVAADTLTKMAYPDKLVEDNAPRRYTGYGYTGYAPRPRTMQDVDKLEADRLSRRKATVNVGRAVREADEAFKTEGNPHAFGSANWHRHEQGLRPAQFHDVLMVAFDITGANAENVHTWLHDQMPAGDTHHGEKDEIFLDSWWVANDERFDRSDCDSAVFVTKGNQEAARYFLREKGLAN